MAVLIKVLTDFIQSEIVRIALKLKHPENDLNFELVKQYNYQQVKYLVYRPRKILCY